MVLSNCEHSLVQSTAVGSKISFGPTAQEKKIEWSAQCQVFLLSDLLLMHFDFSKEIVVAADATKDGMGAISSHRNHDGREKAIFHAARSLRTFEKNYT